MELDALLDRAAGDRHVSASETLAISQLIDSIAVPRGHRRPPRSVFIALIAAGALVVGGGVTTAAAVVAGHHPKWYDAASDWTEKAQTVNRTFLAAGVSYTCKTNFIVASNHNGTSTPEFTESMRFMGKLDAAAIQPDTQWLLPPSTTQENGPSITPAQNFQNAWVITVYNVLRTDLTNHHLNPEYISMSTTGTCNFPNK